MKVFNSNPYECRRIKVSDSKVYDTDFIIFRTSSVEGSFFLIGDLKYFWSNKMYERKCKK